MTYRVDLIFSYWIFVWYLLYEFKIIHSNPKFALTIALIENMIGLCLMIYYSTSKKYIFSFIVIMVLIKVIPLWRLKNTKYEINFYMTFLFIAFLLWLSINEINVLDYHKEKLDSLKNNKPFDPFMHFLIA
jgi:hypothetical protein